MDKDAQKVTILEPGKEYQRDDGSKAVGYNAKIVYDVSQTSAKDRQNRLKWQADIRQGQRGRSALRNLPHCPILRTEVVECQITG